MGRVGYIYNGQSERENKKHPSRRVLFLLQKNTGNDERQIMTSIEKCGYPQKSHGND